MNLHPVLPERWRGLGHLCHLCLCECFCLLICMARNGNIYLEITCSCVSTGNTCWAWLLRGSGNMELWQPHLYWAFRFFSLWHCWVEFNQVQSTVDNRLLLWFLIFWGVFFAYLFAYFHDAIPCVSTYRCIQVFGVILKDIWDHKTQRQITH